jgi:hypothetical protein
MVTGIGRDYLAGVPHTRCDAVDCEEEGPIDFVAGFAGPASAQQGHLEIVDRVEIDISHPEGAAEQGQVVE